MASGDSNGIDSGRGNSEEAGIGNVPILASQAGVDPGIAGIQPHASARSVPAGSAVTLPL